MLYSMQYLRTPLTCLLVVLLAFAAAGCANSSTKVRGKQEVVIGTSKT